MFWHIQAIFTASDVIQSIVNKQSLVNVAFTHFRFESPCFVCVYTSFTFVFYQLYAGLCISRPLSLCLATDPGCGPQFVFADPGPQFVFTGSGPQFVFTGPGLQFVFIGPDLKLLLSVRSISLHIPTLSPQFVFTGPGLQFVLPVQDLNLHLPFYW